MLRLSPKALALSVLALSSALTPSFASAYDVVSNACPSTIEVSISKNGSIRQFTYCDSPADRSTCRVLGKQEWYTRSELTSQRAWEFAKMAGNGVVTAYFGFLTGTTGVAAIGTGGLMMAAPVASAGGAALYGTKTYKRYRDAQRLADDVIDDRKVQLSLDCAAFRDEALAFEDVLNRI